MSRNLRIVIIFLREKLYTYKGGYKVMYNTQLDAFIKAAELKSFSKAAQETYITPTALIQQINSLESRLNIQLFTRSRRGIELTPAGEIILEAAKQIKSLPGMQKNATTSKSTKSVLGSRFSILSTTYINSAESSTPSMNCMILNLFPWN